MKKIFAAFLLLLSGFGLKCQTMVEAKEGSISFITSQNVYVKFQSTANIAVGDTLFTIQDTKKTPVLIVKDMSSISCVCKTISANQWTVGDKVSTQYKIGRQKISGETEPKPAVVQIVAQVDSTTAKKEMTLKARQSISGRISISSYSNFSSVSDLSQRMQYTFSMNARNVGNSKLSGEAYISFAHKINEWSVVKSNIFNGLKIYSLALNYSINKNSTVWIGRKVNPLLSSVGAVDGLQYESKFKSLTVGIFAGTRPDYMNYSFNAKLLQYGGYVSHERTTSNGNMQTSAAFVEQKNNGFTDRRFAYFQHTNSLLTNLYLFGSVEFDLYKKVMNSQDSTFSQDNKPSMSNVYVSLRYRVVKQLSLSLSYSTRQNIIYYETYKTIIDQLLAMANTQGYTFQVSYRPGKYISLGANAGYRFSKQDPKPSKNLYSYLTYSNVPWINACATISATLMETTYVSGSIYSAGLSRDLIPGKLFGGLDYRRVNYKFINTDAPLVQNMAEMNLTWIVAKKLSLSLNYEGTFEKGRNYDRVFVNLTKRF